MRGLDDTDRTILRLLVEDGRRSWREIADIVDLSPPAVADRVERLRDIGIVRGFTVDVDRSKLREGVPVLVTLSVTLQAASAIASDLGEVDSVEHVFVTADEEVVFNATVESGDVLSLLESSVVMEDVHDYEVSLLADREWTPHVGEAELALECAECGNTVTSEGETARLDGDLYHFCCGSCRENFVEMYEELREGADA
jgi:Lrp/AsnC family leucine-responsive transcriptional regulator